MSKKKNELLNKELFDAVEANEKTKYWIKGKVDEFDSIAIELLKYVYNVAYTQGKLAGKAEMLSEIENKLDIKFDFAKK